MLIIAPGHEAIIGLSFQFSDIDISMVEGHLERAVSLENICQFVCVLLSPWI